MLKQNAIRLNAVKAGMEEGKYVVRVEISNPEKRTLYIYGSVRRTFYDSATGKLTLILHDQHLTAEEERKHSHHLRQPHFVPLEANTETELILRLEPILNRMRSAAERGTGPVFEELHISEAKEIDIEIAHQDTPFYYNPNMENAAQLKAWGSAIAKGVFKVGPEAGRSGSEPKSRE